MSRVAFASKIVEAVSPRWTDRDQTFIARRYDRVAKLIPTFEWLLFLPAGFRARAVKALDLRPGDAAVEIGCGTGRNFPYLVEAVGAQGCVTGVDISPGMLAEAQRLCDDNGWRNVDLAQQDAGTFTPPARVDAVLFGLSYNTMPHHERVLRNAWRMLKPGGRLVIMDARAPGGFGGKLALIFGVWIMKLTLLGNPYVKPWEHLAALAGGCEVEQYRFGSYYVAMARKPGLAAALDAEAA